MSAATVARTAGALACLALCLATGCNRKPASAGKEAPPAVSVQPDADPALVQVQNPAAFPLVAAASYEAPAKLNATGTVNPDVSRTIPVISIASGRVVAIHARMGDFVKKGQLLMEVQSNDVATAFNTYLKAVSDERLTQVQLNRARLLLDKGAIPASQLEIAQNAEDDAAAILHLHDRDWVYLPVDGTRSFRRVAEEVEQQVTVPIEIHMAGIPHLEHLRSTSLAGLSSVMLIFDDDSTDKDNRQEVYQRLGQVTLPTGLQPQMGTDWSPVGQIYWYTLRSTNPAYDSMELKSLEDWKLEKEFKSVPGVVDVSSFGGITREYQVRLDPDKLIAYGLSIAQVEQQLANNNVNAGGNFIEQGEQ